MKLIVEIQLSEEWLKDLDKHPMIRRFARTLLVSSINASLLERGKVVKSEISGEGKEKFS